MSARVARLVALAGMVVAGLGLLVGLLPLTVEGQSCGRALRAAHLFEPDECPDKRSTARLVVVPLLVLGGGGIIVGGVAWAAATAPARTED